MKRSIRFSPSILLSGLIVLAFASLLAKCGGSGGGAVEQETITGKVIDG